MRGARGLATTGVVGTIRRGNSRAEVMAEICGADKVSTTVAPSTGGEDFSYMLQKVPGAMVWLGNGPGEGGCLLHNAKYDFNDTALPYGVSFFARLAERFLERPNRFNFHPDAGRGPSLRSSGG